MAWFYFRRRDRYPSLDIQVLFRPIRTDRNDYTVNATVSARGEVAERERWRREFQQWAQSRGIDVIRPRFGPKRAKDSSAFELTLEGWTVAADFLFVWVGEEAFHKAIDGTDQLARRFGEEMRPLAREIAGLTDTVARLERLALRQEERLSSIGRSMLA